MTPHIEGKETPVVETTDHARQGRKGRPVAVVLGISLVLAIAAGFFLGYIRL
jgi:hypothetical protein